jgi:hypothetical protein
MNVVDPIDLPEAAVAAIHHHASLRMVLNQLLRLPIPDVPEPTFSEGSRIKDSRNLSTRKSCCPLTVEIMAYQKYLVSRRLQILCQREIRAIHAPVSMESSADDEPGLSLAMRTVLLLCERNLARADLFWNLGRRANHNQSFLVDQGLGSMYRRIPPPNVMFTLGSRPAHGNRAAHLKIWENGG